VIVRRTTCPPVLANVITREVLVSVLIERILLHVITMLRINYSPEPDQQWRMG
jgi:hypothetical protein